MNLVNDLLEVLEKYEANSFEMEQQIRYVVRDHLVKTEFKFLYGQKTYGSKKEIREILADKWHVSEKTIQNILYKEEN